MIVEAMIYKIFYTGLWMIASGIISGIIADNTLDGKAEEVALIISGFLCALGIVITLLTILFIIWV